MSKGNDKPIIIITGSKGTIGTALRKALKKNFEIVGCDKDSSACEIPIDLSSDDSAKLAFKLFKEKYKNKIACVIHLAAYFDFTGKESPLYDEVNVNGTKRLLEELQDFEVDRFIFASSMLVHKPGVPGEKINEESPLAPKWIYPESKVKTEKIIEKYHGHIPYLILRLAGLYDDSTCVPTLSHQIARIYEQTFKSHFYAGDLHAGQSFIHVEDMIDLFKKAVYFRHELPKKEVILAGEPEAMSYKNLQNRIEHLLHDKERLRTFRIPTLLAKFTTWLERKVEPIIPDDFDQGVKPFIRPFMIDLASDHYAIDIKKAREQLQWEPEHNISDALPMIIQSLKKNPTTWYKENAATYLNDTLIGSLIIGFSILTRPDIGVAPNAAIVGANSPPGWDFSPSAWLQRLPIIILAFIGLFISRYLTAYQLGHINHVWEPFFLGNPLNTKNGTEEIITSYVSKAWPIPDAGLGAITYILEILTGIIGGENRWRTMPWLVLLFGFMIIPLGAVSITFIIIQPILLNTWCTLCLIAAAVMLLQIPYSFDEIVATCVFLWRRYKAGRPILRIFFVGDIDENSKDNKKKQIDDDFEQSPRTIIKKILIGGISVSWSLFICLDTGIWLMFTRLTLGTGTDLANANHLIGSLVVTITVTEFAELIRPVRFLSFIFAISLLIVTFIYDASIYDILINLVLAIVLFIMSIPKGKIKSHYGAWDKFIV